MTTHETEVVVIGGGPGGYAAAFMAADLGMKVTLIDPDDNPGGVCLYRGCIPSKALLHAAKLIGDIRAAEVLGITVSDLKIDTEKLRDWKNEVVAKMTGGLGQLAKQKKVVHLQGKARFEDNHTLAVATHDDQNITLTFSQAVIATGSHPVPPSGFDLSSDHLWNSTDALALATAPKRLLIVGGGYIGLELGTVYAALGTEIHVAEMTDRLLPGADKDLVRFLRSGLKERFEAIHLNTTVKALRERDDGIAATLSGPDHEEQEMQFDKVLVAVGRRPNSRSLGIEKTAIELDDKGFIKVDEQRRTAEPHIFAIGDVAGEPMLAHKATHEGRTAAEVMAQHNVAFNPSVIPAVVFTDPEIAWVGLTEEGAKAEDVKVKIARFPWAAAGRYATLGRSDGLTKLVIDPESERLLGVGMVGAGAGELIAEAALAIEMGANATDIGLTIHPHPTLSETVMEAADVFQGTSTHYHAPKRKK